MIRSAARKCACVMLLGGWLFSARGGICAEHDESCADCRRAERYRRTGYPLEVKQFATTSNTRHYGSYYVGGGSVLPFANSRCLNEGTWGWDYSGILFPKQVALGWSHGRRYQGGTGAYRTVGPTALKTQ